MTRSQLLANAAKLRKQADALVPQIEEAIEALDYETVADLRARCNALADAAEKLARQAEACRG